MKHQHGRGQHPVANVFARHHYACKCNCYIRCSGEMSHHEVLDASANGTSVIVSDHSNSERGFLTVFREKLAVRLPDSVTVAVSKADRDPLEVVWPTLSNSCTSQSCCIKLLTALRDVCFKLICVTWLLKKKSPVTVNQLRYLCNMLWWIGRLRFMLYYLSCSPAVA